MASGPNTRAASWLRTIRHGTFACSVRKPDTEPTRKRRSPVWPRLDSSSAVGRIGGAPSPLLIASRASAIHAAMASPVLRSLTICTKSTVTNGVVASASVMAGGIQCGAASIVLRNARMVVYQHRESGTKARSENMQAGGDGVVLGRSVRPNQRHDARARARTVITSVSVRQYRNVTQSRCASKNLDVVQLHSVTFSSGRSDTQNTSHRRSEASDEAAIATA